MKLIRSSVLVAVLLAVTAVPTLAGAVPVVTNQLVPFEGSFFVSCANGEAGENVDFSGEVHLLEVVVPNASGGMTYTMDQNIMGLTGVGETTGTRYHIQGAGHLTQTWQAAGAGTYSLTNNVRVVAAGRGNDLSMHMLT
jgi:hypothetical protein